MLDKKYPGEHIGVEPTTDRFLAVMNGKEDRVIPGNAAAVNQELPFRGLNHFGQAFLSRFQVSQAHSAICFSMYSLYSKNKGLGNTFACIGKYDHY